MVNPNCTLDNQLRAGKLDAIAGVADTTMRAVLSHALFGGETLDCGSQFRGKLVLMLSSNPEVNISAALAVELIHTASLVVDDLIDGTSERRSSSAVWRKYGKATAILAAHRLVALAFDVASNCSVFQRGLLVQSIANMTETEVSVSETGRAEQYLRYMQAKTGKLVQVAAQIGFGDVDYEVAFMPTVIGNIGVLHQIEDDRRDFARDVKAPSKQGRQNLFSLAEMEVAKIIDWRAKVCVIDIPHLVSMLRVRPNSEEIIDALRLFSGLEGTDANGFLLDKSSPQNRSLMLVRAQG